MARAKCPAKGARVRTPDGRGVVAKSMKHFARVRLDGRTGPAPKSAPAELYFCDELTPARRRRTRR